MNTKLPMAARGAAVVAALICASSLAAQIYTPSYASPRSMGDFGVYVADGPGNFSLEGILRSGLGAYDFGFRGGVATGVGPGDDTYALVGVDMRNPFTITGAPLDFAFTAAFQGMIGDDSRAGGPLASPPATPSSRAISGSRPTFTRASRSSRTGVSPGWTGGSWRTWDSTSSSSP
jgi:hypothetical protein